MKSFKMLGRLPKDVILGCSGGVDSMAVLDFLIRGRRDVIVLNIDHGTGYGSAAADFLSAHCKQNNIKYIQEDVSSYEKDPSVSMEANWHNFRYKIFSSVSSQYNRKVITCHHLDDQVENWIMTPATGNPVLIPYQNVNAGVIRPFLLTRKESMYAWCKVKDVPYIEDPSNLDTKYTRTFVRKELVPMFCSINPGIHKTIAKKVLSQYNVN